MTITVNGKADVLAQLSIDVANDYKDISLKEGEQPYKPIKWTLKKNNAAVDGVSDVTLETLVGKLNSTETTINAGDNIDDTYTISWSWPLDSSNDDADTVLGWYSAGKTGNYNSSIYTDIVNQIKLDLSVTIKQIQNS